MNNDDLLNYLIATDQLDEFLGLKEDNNINEDSESNEITQDELEEDIDDEEYLEKNK